MMEEEEEEEEEEKKKEKEDSCSNYKDIIRELKERRLLTRIAERILGLLLDDYASLRNAELVSDDWQQVVASGKLYRKWFKRKLASDSEWAKMYGIRKQQQQQEQEQQSFIGCEDEQQEHNYYKQLCNDVEQSIEMLRNNWKRTTGYCCINDSLLLLSRESSSIQQQQQRIESFKMDHLRIVIHHQVTVEGAAESRRHAVGHGQHHCFSVFNRWTRHLERRIQMTRVRHSERIKTADDVLNYDFANNILVVFLVQTAADDDDDDGGGNNQSLVQGATAEIWNVLTGEKVHVFQDEPSSVWRRSVLLRRSRTTTTRHNNVALTTGGRLSASGKYLASFVEHYETDDCDFRRVLTLRKFSDGCSSSVATIVDQILDRDTLLPDAVNNVAKIYLDDAYVIVEYRRNRRLDIRSTELFGVLLHTLSLIDSILVDYSGGYFMSRIRGSPDGVKIWDAQSSHCVATIAFATSNLSITNFSKYFTRMIDDTSYLVVCQSNYCITGGGESHRRSSRMRVYDLKSIITTFKQQQQQREDKNRQQHRLPSSSSSTATAAVADGGGDRCYCYSGDGSDLLVSDLELGDRPFSDLVAADKYQIYLLLASSSSRIDYLQQSADASRQRGLAHLDAAVIDFTGDDGSRRRPSSPCLL